MKYKETERSCIICGETKDEIIWDMQKRLKQGKLKCKYLIKDGGGKFYNMKIVICVSCGLIYTNPMLDEETLDEFYQEEYRKIFLPEMDSVPVNHSRSALRTLRLIEKDVQFKTILDVGCGPAKTLINDLNALGYTAEGYDTDKSIQGVYHNYEDLPPGYDVVTCFNTLEHLWDPITFLSSLRTKVKKCLIIGVPNVYGFFNCNVDAWFSKAHLWHFSDVSLGNVLRLAGYGIHRGLSVQEPMGDKIHIIAVPTTKNKGTKIKKPFVEVIKGQLTHLSAYQEYFIMPKYER